MHACRSTLEDPTAEYARRYEPILADRLRVRLDSKKLALSCTRKSQTLKDEKGESLGHLRCDFVFEAEAIVTPGQMHDFDFREGNYLLEEGRIDVAAEVAGGLRVALLIAPDDELKKRATTELRPGDDDRLREVKIRFSLPAVTTAVAPASDAPVQPPSKASDADHTGLKELLTAYLVRGELSFWVVMLLALAFGAAHALTPGHGKTLVAAYLVGQRGTVWHAVFLGLMTTLSHTGAVLVLALVLGALPEAAQTAWQQRIATGVGLALGLLIVGLGFWLLLQRLSGKADHFHVGGGHHHHHHGHDASSPPTGKVTWWGLVLLGVTGGLVPCWDAIILLVATITAGVFWLAFPLVFSFSVGLAATLVLVGILVVKFRGFAESRWGGGPLVRALPVISALLVTAMGFWLCYESVQGR